MLSLIKKHEGLCSKIKGKNVLATENDIKNNITIYPYLCPANKLTIGWGCVVEKGRYDNGISVQECELLLQDRVKTFCKQIDSLKINFTQNQYSAILSFVYNLGFGAFEKSTLLKKIKEKNEVEIKKEWIKWCMIGKTKSQGLLKRREEELSLYFTI